MNNQPHSYSFSIEELNISKETVVDIITGSNEKDTHQFYIDELDEELQKFKGYNEIKGGYIITDNIQFNPACKEITVEGQTFSVGNIIYNELKNAQRIIVFTCTAGKTFCDYAKDMYKTDLLKGYLLESAANVLVETAMDKIHFAIKDEVAKEGLLVSNRYSPGYCTWNVVEQQKLFQLLPLAFCGVTLSESSLMNPIKSISGFMGVGKEIKYQSYKCKHCTQKKCIYRNKFV